MSVKKLFDLSGRVAVVTGGSRGLGLQIAEALGEMGATLALTARKKDELDAAVARLAAQGVKASAWPCDLGRRDAVAPAADAILEKHGRVDILVNNAGANWAEPAEAHSIEGWDRVVNLNLTGTFLLTQRIAARAMIPAKYGRIVNVASVNGLIANDPRLVLTAAYVTTKHGLVGLTKQLAAEWGRHGITVNALCPGFFPSKMTRATLDKDGAFLVAGTPTGRLGGDQDLKGAAVLLASDAGAHITGHALVVDGGASII
jgi:NAD(P)-dependent dehydrogenase (short-subunit alcohol dehydrogenase family)